MTKEFNNLSEKECILMQTRVYKRMDVKEFIKFVEDDFEIELNTLIRQDGKVSVSDVRTALETIMINRAGDKLK